MTERRPLIFFSDFDDTLYFHDGRGLQESDVQAVQEFQKSGNLFVLCTGRPVCMKEAIEEKTGGKIRFDMEIYSCGSVILDSRNSVLFEKQLPTEFVRLALKQFPDINFRIHTGDTMYFSRKPNPEEGVLLTDFSDLEGKKIYEMSVDLADEKHLEAIRTLSAHHGVSCYRNRYIADFVSNGISKASGLQKVCELAGSDLKNSGAMGDSFNDIPMIEAAGYGFTFPEAETEVKEAAGWIENSIAQALKKMEELSD